VFCTETES
jgi:hypothetical protein